ncbi:MAG: DUF4493 domain-containing protein [Bacteroidales bacterium]|nr:DUF4493 domain-containing protein [Bacteroidales bacterium]
MRNLKLGLEILVLALMALAAGACSKERVVQVGSDEGALLVSLERTAAKATVELPAVDSFWVELYNAKGVRFYSRQYAQAKQGPIGLNTGQFRLIAFSGDTLGAGFGKAYYVADTTFTVHPLSQNGGQPDRVSAVARLGNVRLAVNFGENLRTYYSDYYAVVRHNTLSGKKVKFRKDEDRYGYIPGGEIYLEVFAQLAGSGMQDGGVADSLVYWRSDVKNCVPGDFITFNIDCPERNGQLGFQFLIDNTVQTEDILVSVPATTPPFISYRGGTGSSFTQNFSIGAGASAGDATLSFGSASGIREAVLQISNGWLTGTLGLPASTDLLDADDATLAKLRAAGISWNADYGTRYGYVNMGGTLPGLSIHSEYSTSNPDVAAFTLTVKDGYGKSATSTLNLRGEPIKGTVYAEATDLWAWKVANPRAVLRGVDVIMPEADLRLQYSVDGNTWMEATKKSVSGNTVYFNDAKGLQSATQYRFRVMAGGNADNITDESRFTTESEAQLPNSGFEEITEQATEVPTGLGLGLMKFTITWWQLYQEGGLPKIWAVNSLVSIREKATAAYQDYKSYPTVAVFTDGAYSGNSVQVATIGEGNLASEAVYGTYHSGELFIGKANNQVYSSWAKTGEGTALTTRPYAVAFKCKFNCNDSKPYYVHAEILDAGGNKIGEATKNDQTSSVNDWTTVTVPFSYSITDRKAASLKLSFMSSKDASDDDHRSVTVNTLSGEHKIHAGNILSLDNIELVYHE